MNVTYNQPHLKVLTTCLLPSVVVPDPPSNMLHRSSSSTISIDSARTNFKYLPKRGRRLDDPSALDAHLFHREQGFLPSEFSGQESLSIARLFKKCSIKSIFYLAIAALFMIRVYESQIPRQMGSYLHVIKDESNYNVYLQTRNKTGLSINQIRVYNSNNLATDPSHHGLGNQRQDLRSDFSSKIDPKMLGGSLGSKDMVGGQSREFAGMGGGYHRISSGNLKPHIANTNNFVTTSSAKNGPPTFGSTTAHPFVYANKIHPVNHDSSIPNGNGLTMKQQSVSSTNSEPESHHVSETSYGQLGQMFPRQPAIMGHEEGQNLHSHDAQQGLAIGWSSDATLPDFQSSHLTSSSGASPIVGLSANPTDSALTMSISNFINSGLKGSPRNNLRKAARVDSANPSLRGFVSGNGIASFSDPSGPSASFSTGNEIPEAKLSHQPIMTNAISTQSTQVTMAQNVDVVPQRRPASSFLSDGSAVLGQTSASAASIDQILPSVAPIGQTMALADPLDQISPPPLSPDSDRTTTVLSQDNHLSELQNFKNNWDPYDKNDNPVFWHIPKAGGSTVKDIIGSCYNLVMASEYGVTDGHANDTNLEVVYPNSGGISGDGLPSVGRSSFVNVDTTTVEGIQRAKAMGFADAHLSEITVTPFVYEANDLFASDAAITITNTTNNKGRLFSVFRHPIDRAVSMFYYLQVATWEPTYKPEFQKWTLEQYAHSNLVENNWMTRMLSKHSMEGPVDDDRSVKIAMEVVRQKFLVGLLSDLDGSMDRFDRFFRWNYHANPTVQEACRQQLLSKGSNSNKTLQKEKVQPGNPAWDILALQNQYDLQLYNYIERLYKEQEAFVTGIPTKDRLTDNTCCMCDPPTFPLEGYRCPDVALNQQS